MAEGKKIVNVYIEWIEIFNALSDEQSGKLIKHFFKYINDLDPEPENEIINIAFIPIKQQLKRDLKKWLNKSEKNRENANMRWHKDNANACERIKQDAKNADKVEDKVKDKDKKDNIFNDFWNKYHLTTKQSKTDREPTLKYWKKLTDKEKQKAIDNIKPYYNSIPDYGKGKMPKKARTYLSDKNFNDEYHSLNQTQPINLDVKLIKPKPIPKGLYD